jgi:hypothetical protein
MKYVYLVALLMVSLLVVSGCSKSNITTDPVACTMDAKICSDGTAVGRNGSNNCEFDACSDEKIYVGKSPEQCQVIKFMCAEGKQYFSDNKGCGCEPIPNETATTGKLQAIDCVERTQACTREYMPVCGQVQVQCIRAPCPPVMQTFSNKCEACANSLTISYTQGACASDAP